MCKIQLNTYLSIRVKTTIEEERYIIEFMFTLNQSQTGAVLDFDHIFNRVRQRTIK